MSELNRIDTGGQRLAWREVVFLHGIGALSQGWHAQLDYFGAQYRSIAWDAPGYGGSGDLAANAPSAGDYGDALAALLTALDIESAYLVGNSLGALMAAGFWRRHPARVRAMVLSDAATGQGRARPDVQERAIRGRLAPLAELGPAGVAAERAVRLVAPGTDSEILAEVRDGMAAIRPDGYRQATLMLAYSDINDELAGCDVSTLVVCGTKDRITPAESNQRIANALVNARYEPMAGLGHLPHVEAPRRFNGLVEGFLNAQ